MKKKEIKPRTIRDYDNIKAPSPIYAHTPQPKKDRNMFKRAWRKAKETAIERLIPTLRQEIKVDLNAHTSEVPGKFMVSVNVKIKNITIIRIQRNFKV